MQLLLELVGKKGYSVQIEERKKAWRVAEALFTFDCEIQIIFHINSITGNCHLVHSLHKYLSLKTNFEPCIYTTPSQAIKKNTPYRTCSISRALDCFDHGIPILLINPTAYLFFLLFFCLLRVQVITCTSFDTRYGRSVCIMECVH